MPVGLLLQARSRRMRARDGRESRVVCAAEQLHDGYPEELALEVPERDVDRGEREGRDAAAVPVPPGAPSAAPPDVDVVERVASDDELVGDPVDHRLGRPACVGPRRDRLSPADGPVVRLDAAEGQMADGAAVVRLRVPERDRLDGSDGRHTRTSSMPSARASTGISTSSRPRASALWCVAPEAIQRAPPRTRSRSRSGTSRSGRPSCRSAPRRSRPSPRRGATCRRPARARAPSPAPARAGTRATCPRRGRPGSGRWARRRPGAADRPRPGLPRRRPRAASGPSRARVCRTRSRAPGPRAPARSRARARSAGRRCRRPGSPRP